MEKTLIRFKVQMKSMNMELLYLPNFKRGFITALKNLIARLETCRRPPTEMYIAI